MRQVPPDIAAKLALAADRLASSFEDVRMEDIAAAAGVSRTLLYYYFTGKDDLLAFWLRSMLDDLARATAAAASAPGDVADRLENVVRVQLEHLNAHPAASQMLLANLGRAGKLPDIAVRIKQAFEQPLRRLLEEGTASGALRPALDATTVATALFGAVVVPGLFGVVLEGSLDVDRLASLLTEVFLSGLRSEAGPSSMTPHARTRTRTARAKPRAPGGA